MPNFQPHKTTANFGTLPLFMTTISTILGAILFLRFGYAAGLQGFIGVICLISLLEHFAADPSYRPTFKSRWYVSLLGAVTSFWLMFKMNTPYALLSLIVMGSVYFMVSSYKKKEIK